MDAVGLGAAIRALRIRRGWRQVDLARRAHTSQAQISRVERGQLTRLTVGLLESIALALDADLRWSLRWRGGDLGRLLDERHAALQNQVAARLAAIPGWEFATEATFSIYGERGSIDVLGWHPLHRALLVVELKSELVDLQDLVSTLDRKRRLAREIARGRGWDGEVVGAWLIIEEGTRNRQRVQEHAAVLRHAYPADGHAMAAWLRAPIEPILGMSFLANNRRANGKRVRPLLQRGKVRRGPTSDLAPRAGRA